MEQMSHKYVTVAYELYSDNAKGVHELIEKAPAEHPFQFVSGLGMTLDLFEQNILACAEGDTFDFTLGVEDAYGPYENERVLELDKEIFMVNGQFDSSVIYPGNFIPLVNGDGVRFQGLVLEVKDDKVVVDLNHPLAGRALHFKGSVVTSREATNEEIQGMLSMMSGEGGCGCGCGEGGCEGGCGEGGCGCGEGEGGCGGHHHEHEGGCCCGHN